MPTPKPEPVAYSVINESLDLISKRIDAVSQRSDAGMEKVSDRLVDLASRIADVASDQKIVLQQVRLTNGTVIKHDERLTAIEKGNIERDKEDVVRDARRALITNQIKVLWGLLIALLAAACGAYVAHLLK